MAPTHDPPDALSRPTSVRDKCWQRQLVADRGLLPQPWFVAVTDDRVGLADLGDVLLARLGSYILNRHARLQYSKTRHNTSRSAVGITFSASPVGRVIHYRRMISYPVSRFADACP